MYTTKSIHGPQILPMLSPKKNSLSYGLLPRPLSIWATPSSYQSHNRWNVRYFFLRTQKIYHRTEFRKVTFIYLTLSSNSSESAHKPPNLLQPPLNLHLPEIFEVRCRNTQLFGAFLHTLMVGIRSGGILKAHDRK